MLYLCFYFKIYQNDIKLLQIDRQTNVFIKDHLDEQKTKGGGTNKMEDQEEKPETDQKLDTETTELKLENEMVNFAGIIQFFKKILSD